jgi:arylsulfatase A-like enzyme
MIRGPGVEPGRRAGLASGIDLTPTILRFTGADWGAELEGFALQRSDSTPLDRTVFVEAGNKFLVRAAIREHDKWVAHARAGKRQVRGRRYYDLATDPGEADPRPWEPDDTAAALIDRFLRDPDPGGLPGDLRAGMRIDAPKVAPRADDAAIERLRALGYVD